MNIMICPRGKDKQCEYSGCGHFSEHQEWFGHSMSSCTYHRPAKSCPFCVVIDKPTNGIIPDERRNMEAKELIKKIFVGIQECRDLCRACDFWDKQGGYCFGKDPQYCESNSYLLALIKEALPELAKEAGWKSPEEVAFFTADVAKAEGYVKLADIRQAIGIEYNKAIKESKADPFQVGNLDHEHYLTWKGHANAYSEVISYLDMQAGGK